MTLQTDLIAIGYVKVGEGVGASPSYPVLRVQRRHETTVAEGGDAVAFRTRTFTLRCAAEAADLDSVASLKATLESQLARAGQRVEIGEHGGTTVLAASSVTGVRGEPRVSIEFDADASVGVWVEFSLTIDAREPVAASGVVLDERETSTEIDTRGFTTITTSGRVRIAPGGSYSTARAYIEAEILAALLTQAVIDGRTNRRRFRVGLDALECSYEIVIADPADGTNPGANITRAELVDETRRDSSGRTTRSVSGFAEGVGSSSYAASAKPTLGSGDLLVTDRVSQPSGAAGRVNFNYEVLNGVAPGGDFGSLRVFSFAEEFDIRQGGRRLEAAVYPTADPVLYRGVTLPYIYTQRTTIEFNGSWAEARSVADGATMDEANLVELPQFRTSEPRPGVRRVTATVVYMYPDAQTEPTPRQIAGLS